MRPTNDPGFRVVTLTALCWVFEITDSKLLERTIQIQQRDTKSWLRNHPEHVRAFCDAYYDRREEAYALAKESIGDQEINPDFLDCNGIWTILSRRYEPRQMKEKRFEDAGYRTFDSTASLRTLFSEEELQKIDAETEERNRRMAADIESGRDAEWPMNHTFWLPDREESYGEFTVRIAKKHSKRMDRIRDYWHAGDRFPTTDYTAYFDELRALSAISDEDHQNLLRWVAYNSQPKATREAMKSASRYRPITDSLKIAKFKELLSDVDSEIDELDDSELPSITSSRREANRVIESLADSSGKKKE